MRRGSLIGPMLLILLGGLFLANNLRPELPVLQIISTYWPYLLIGWGALRFAEIVFWSMSGKPLPAHGISGGEWALVIFLTIFGTGMFYANRYSDRWPSTRLTMRGLEVLGDSYDFQHAEQKHAVGKTPRIMVENFRGNVRITGADTEELRVSGRSSIRAFQQSEAERVHKECPLELVKQGDMFVLRSNQNRASGTNRMTSDMEVTVPKGATIQGRGRAGDFDISLVSAVDVDSDNAGVRLNNISGDVHVDLRRSDIIRAANVGGNVELKGTGNDVDLENIVGQAVVNGSYSGELIFRNLAKPLRFESSTTELRIEKVSGQVRMNRGELDGRGLTGPVMVKTRAKDIQLGDFTQSLDLEVERGDVELRPGMLPLAKVDVRIQSGNIHFAVPPAARFEMRAHTERGSIENEYGSPLRVDSVERGARLEGSVGGGPPMTLNTDRGTITVRKVTGESQLTPEAPPAPAPPPAEKGKAGAKAVTELKVQQQ